MRGEDRRIAWLLSREALDHVDGAMKGCLSAAAEAGFRVVAVDLSMATIDCGPEVESEAKRMGLHIIRVEEVEHCRLVSVLDSAERRTLAHALSKAGFDGFILCGGGDCQTPDKSMFATARALLRDLDQLDWESSH